MRKLLHAALALVLALLVGCGSGGDDSAAGPEPATEPPTQTTQAAEPTKPTKPPPTQDEREAAMIAGLIDGMTLEQQVAQLFMLNLGPDNASSFTEPDEAAMAFVDATQAGGYILFDGNITTREGTRALTGAVSARGEIPALIAIDEEGGEVSRLSMLPDYTNQPAASVLAARGDVQAVYDAGSATGEALRDIGVHLDFAPCADVLTNPFNTVVAHRAYGSEPEIAAEMAAAFQRGLHANGILSCPKHFPGHGGTTDDSHNGPVYNPADPESLATVEYVPFRQLIAEGAEFLMLGHILVPNADDSGLPASLSPAFATGAVRDELGFAGVVVTDAMNMSALTSRYPAGQDAVLAIQAGVDMLLMPADFQAARDSVLAAVEDGSISRERLRASLERILRAKLRAGLLDMDI